MHEINIRVKLGDVEIAFRGRRSFFNEWVEPLLAAAYERSGRERRAGAISTAAQDTPGLPVFHPSSPSQFNRFASQVGARAEGPDQRTMAFAFYLWNFERQDAFRREDIEAFFRTVQDEPPPDLDTLLMDLEQRRRFLKAANGAGSFELTSKGVNYVKNRLLATT